MTNYEKIRNMSVTEMADFFDSFERTAGCDICSYNGMGMCPKRECTEGIKEYLEREVEE